jgi:P27 family predicted phage terminase small subunit
MRGTKRSRVNLAEPRPLAGVPITRPPGLSPHAAEEWARVMPHLESMGVLSAADTTGLACYCEAVARWRKLAEVVAVSPPLVPGADGGGVLVKNPAYAMMRDAANEVRVWAREFGLTPSARSGIHVTVHSPHDRDPGRLLTMGGGEELPSGLSSGYGRSKHKR